MGLYRTLNDDTGPDAEWLTPQERSFLENPAYRTISTQEIRSWSDETLVDFMADARWGAGRKGKQACPACGSLDSHYKVKSTGGWKCRDKECGKFFTIFSGTCLHGVKESPRDMLEILFRFVEAKDSVSASEIARGYDRSAQSTRVLLMKVREAIRVSMQAEPKLTGYIQADGAYFAKYVRPGNVGTGAALAMKAQQMKAGTTEPSAAAKRKKKSDSAEDEDEAKPKPVVSEKVHALIVYVQQAPAGKRRYKVAVTKTEEQIRLLEFAARFCDTGNSTITTDQHAGYNPYAGMFAQHKQVNHSKEFQTKDGVHTNHAENFFSRMRAAVHGAWHKVTVEHLEEYAWEFAWRQTMTMTDNRAQLQDLLRKVLAPRRAERWVDYWGSRKRKAAEEQAAEAGTPVSPAEPKESSTRLMPIDGSALKRKRGRPRKEAVPAKVETPAVPRQKRAYRRRVVTGPAAPAELVPDSALHSQPSASA